MLTNLWTHFATLLLSVTAVLFAYAIYRFVQNFRAATGTIWQRAVAAAKQSATVLWGYILTASGYATTWIDSAAEFLNMPEMQALLQKNVTPTRFGIFIMVAGGVSILARLRHIIMAKLAELRAPPQQAASS